MPLTVRFSVPLFRIESVRLAVWLIVRVPNERFPVRPMMRVCAPEPLAGMVEVPEVAVELTVMFPL